MVHLLRPLHPYLYQNSHPHLTQFSVSLLIAYISLLFLPSHPGLSISQAHFKPRLACLGQAQVKPGLGRGQASSSQAQAGLTNNSVPNKLDRHSYLPLPFHPPLIVSYLSAMIATILKNSLTSLTFKTTMPTPSPTISPPHPPHLARSRPRAV